MTAGRISAWPFVVYLEDQQAMKQPQNLETLEKAQNFRTHLAGRRGPALRRDDGFAYGDWTAPYRAPAGRDLVLALHGASFDLLPGRRTYDLWSGYWPNAQGSPMANGIHAATKYVATHNPETLKWGPFESLGPDIVEGVRRIKSQDGPDIVLWGSSTLVSALLWHGLADEVLLIVYPILLGTGSFCWARKAFLFGENPGKRP